MIDYSLDIVEVNGEDRSKRGKRGGRKRLFEMRDGTHLILPDNQTPPEGVQDLLKPLKATDDLPALRERVLQQLATGRFGL
jgi:nicotinate phosphoribosyltransferase